MIKLYVDAASNGKAVGVGFVIYKNKEQYPYQLKLAVALDNHRAEFEAVFKALCVLKEKRWCDTLFLYSDSKVVVQALQRRSAKGEWQQEYLAKILPLLDEFPLVFVEWFSQSENRLPDQLAKRALHLEK